MRGPAVCLRLMARHTAGVLLAVTTAALVAGLAMVSAAPVLARACFAWDVWALMAPRLWACRFGGRYGDLAVGKVSNSGRASLGISAETVADASGQPAGVGVVAVAPGGAAAKAGVRAGDVIVSLAGQPTDSATALQAVLAPHKPGDRVPMRLSRGALSTVEVTLGSLTS